MKQEVTPRLKRAAEIRGTKIIRLSIEGQRQIAAAILKPPAPAAALKRAARRYRDIAGTA
jgi:uncharacterized protein (DUF1778 family)